MATFDIIVTEIGHTGARMGGKKLQIIRFSPGQQYLHVGCEPVELSHYTTRTNVHGPLSFHNCNLHVLKMCLTFSVGYVGSVS